MILRVREFEHRIAVALAKPRIGDHLMVRVRVVVTGIKNDGVEVTTFGQPLGSEFIEGETVASSQVFEAAIEAHDAKQA